MRGGLYTLSRMLENESRRPPTECERAAITFLLFVLWSWQSRPIALHKIDDFPIVTYTDACWEPLETLGFGGKEQGGALGALTVDLAILDTDVRKDFLRHLQERRSRSFFTPPSGRSR